MGLTAVRSVADVFATDPKSCATVVHVAGAAVGAAWYWFALRKFSTHAAALRKQVAFKMPKAAQSAKGPAFTEAAVAKPRAPAPTDPRPSTPAAPAVYVAPEIKPLQTAAPANENMRTTPPVAKNKRRHFSTSAFTPSTLPAAPRVVCTPIGRQMHVQVLARR